MIKAHVHKWLCMDGIANDCEQCIERDQRIASFESSEAYRNAETLAAERLERIAELEAKLARIGAELATANGPNR